MTHALSLTDWLAIGLQLAGAVSVVATVLGRVTASIAPGFSRIATAIGVDVAKIQGEGAALTPVVEAIEPPAPTAPTGPTGPAAP
jgi:hypothetical protein